MLKTYRHYRDARLNKLRQVIENRVESGVLPIPSYGLIGRDTLLRKPYTTPWADNGLTDAISVYYDRNYSVGCLRGTVSFNPKTGITAEDTTLDCMGFTHDEISVLDAGFEGNGYGQYPKYQECYSFGQHIREDFCVTRKSNYPFKLKFVR